MEAAEVLDELTARGVELVAAGDRLRFFPAEEVPPSLLEELRSHKAELLELVELRDWPEESREAVRRFGVPHARLYPFLGRTVNTPEGAGQLVQVFSDRAGVILDSGPARVTFLLTCDVAPASWRPASPMGRHLGETLGEPLR